MVTHFAEVNKEKVMKVFATPKPSGRGFKVGTTRTANSTVNVRAERAKPLNIGARRARQQGFANFIQRLSAAGNALRGR